MLSSTPADLDMLVGWGLVSPTTSAPGTSCGALPIPRNRETAAEPISVQEKEVLGP